jgi:hypothetical protein
MIAQSRKTIIAKTLGVRFFLALLLFAPLSFYDVFIGLIPTTQLLGPILISLFFSVFFTLVWLAIYGTTSTFLYLFWYHRTKYFEVSLFISELVTFYVFIGFAFYFYLYGMENPGNGISFGVSDGALLQNGRLTELGLRDSIKNIAAIIFGTGLVQFFNAVYLVSKINYELGNEDGR